MEWTDTSLMISNCWIWFLLTLTAYLLQNDQWFASLVVLALAAVEMYSVMQDQEHPIPVVLFVTAVVWYNQALCFTKLCMETTLHASRAITSAFTTGTSASRSYFSLSPKSLITKCWRLRKGYAMAHTRLSTKTLSAAYSDL